MKKNLGRIMIIAGVLLVLASVGLVSYNTYDSARAGMESDRVLDELEELIQQNPLPVPTHIQYIEVDEDGNETVRDEVVYVAPDQLNAVSSAVSSGGTSGGGTAQVQTVGETIPTVQVDEWKYIGVLQIPSLRLTLPVLHKWDYSRLRIAPCRYYGSVYKHNMVIAGHNYSVHFSPVRSIRLGADVYFTDVYGTRYHYRVSKTETVQPNDVERMVISNGQWELTLFTCNLGGATRFACRCQLIETQAAGQEAIPFERTTARQDLPVVPAQAETQPTPEQTQSAQELTPTEQEQTPPEQEAEAPEQEEEPQPTEQETEQPEPQDQEDDQPEVPEQDNDEPVVPEQEEDEPLSQDQPESNVPEPVQQVGQ